MVIYLFKITEVLNSFKYQKNDEIIKIGAIHST